MPVLTKPPTVMAVPTGPLQVGAADGEPLALSVVIPTYKERDNLGELIERLTDLLYPLLGDSFELIVVDDDSPDRTWEVACEIAEDNPHVCVLRRCNERGLATAVVRGWQVARGEILAVMDADLQHPPELIARLWTLLQQRDIDLAVASRHGNGGRVGDWNLFRQMFSLGARLAGMLLLPKVLGRVSDPMSGCFAVRRSSLRNVTLKPKGYKILIEVLSRAQLKGIREIGYVFSSRHLGESKVTLRVCRDYVLQLLQLRLESLTRKRLPR